MADSLEVFINEQRADIEMHRILLMMFFARVIGANPLGAEERLQDLKSSTMSVVAKAAQSSPDDTRMSDLLRDRAEKFLTELEAIVFQARARTDWDAAKLITARSLPGSSVSRPSRSLSVGSL